MAIGQPNWSRKQDFFREIPVTKIILMLWALVFLTTIAIPAPVLRLLAFIPGAMPNTITGLITYPLLIFGPGEIINLLISGYMLWLFGGSLERGWGARTYLLLLIAANAAAALLWSLGVFIFSGRLVVLAGPWLMISSVIVAWAWINPEETIMLWFVLPLKAKWIGWLDIALLYFLFPSSQGARGWPVFILGFFALGGVAVAYGYDWYRRRWGWIPRRRQPASRKVIRHPSSTPFGAALRPFREWQRRRRIARLQRSFHLDDDEKGRGAR